MKVLFMEINLLICIQYAFNYIQNGEKLKLVKLCEEQHFNL